MILMCDITKKRTCESHRYDNGKRLYTVNQYLNRSLIMIFMLSNCSVRVQGVQSFCMAPTTEMGKEAIISCHFGYDISKTQQDVIVYIYKDNGRKPVVQYAWFNGQHKVLQENGYECDGAISEYLVVRIRHTTREHAAQYSCIVAPSDKEEVTPCTLKLIDGSTTTQAKHVGSVHKSDAGTMFSNSTLQYSEVQSSSNKAIENQERKENERWETSVIIALSILIGILLTVLIFLSFFIAKKKYNFFAKSWIFNCIHAKNTPPVNDVEMPLNV